MSPAPKKTPAAAPAKPAAASAAAAKPAAKAAPAAAAKPSSSAAAKPAVASANLGKNHINPYPLYFIKKKIFSRFNCFIYYLLLAKKRVQKGKHLARSRKVHTEVRFRRPKTLSLPRQPRYQRKSAPHRNRYDISAIKTK
jgi:large subunit ribosomal protein L23Ae